MAEGMHGGVCMARGACVTGDVCVMKMTVVKRAVHILLECCSSFDKNCP